MNEAIRSLQTLLYLDQDNDNTAPRVKQGVTRPMVQPTGDTSVAPLKLFPVQRTTRSQTARLHVTGIIIRNKIDNGKFYEGEVTNYDPIHKFCSIEYRDGDREGYMHNEVTNQRKKTQQYSQALKVRPLAFNATESVDRHRLSIPTKANPNPSKRVLPTASPYDHIIHHMACTGGSIWNGDLK